MTAARTAAQRAIDWPSKRPQAMAGSRQGRRGGFLRQKARKKMLVCCWILAEQTRQALQKEKML
jgi:hypothetical protein